MKVMLKLLGILLLVAAAFALGAHQHRTGGWPFGQTGFSVTTKGKSAQNAAVWVENLRKGGYILWFRHAHREKWLEVEAFDSYERASGTEDATQASFRRAVCLSEQGIEEAKIIGKTFELGRIPVGVVVSGPSCRMKQTAQYAFGKYDAVYTAIRFAGLSSDKPLRQDKADLANLLRDVEVRPGTNTVISGRTLNLGRNGLDAVDTNEPDGDTPALEETGFYVIERREGARPRLVFTFKSISELATRAIEMPRK